MKRNIRLEDISDGKLYTANDLVKADCHDCEGCSACCSGMASIVLDPLDVWLLCTGLGKAFEGLMEEHIELQVVDGVILPRLKMSEDSESCSTEDARFIHSDREFADYFHLDAIMRKLDSAIFCK